MKYKIDDLVWWAHLRKEYIYIPCPHCFGKKFLTVIMGDDSKHTIDCECCKQGYLGPRGTIQTYQDRLDPQHVHINRIEVKSDNTIEYGVNGCYCANDADIFDTKEEAENRMKELLKESAQEEQLRLHNKDNYSRTWAWHVTYHRNYIKNAKRDIDYHSIKLDMAKQHIKQEDVKRHC